MTISDREGRILWLFWVLFYDIPLNGPSCLLARYYQLSTSILLPAKTWKYHWYSHLGLHAVLPGRSVRVFKENWTWFQYIWDNIFLGNAEDKKRILVHQTLVRIIILIKPRKLGLAMACIVSPWQFLKNINFPDIACPSLALTLSPWHFPDISGTYLQMSRDMRFPTMWYVRPTKPQTSLRIRAVWSEPLLVAWIFYEC